MKIVIVGGVAGGASAAARLRRLDEHAEIIIFERGEYISFANCGLPYYIGEEITSKSALTLQTPQSFKQRFNIDVRINSLVMSIDKESKIVTVRGNDGEYQEKYDKLILSMGAEPIRPNIKGIESQGVFTLRNIPDTYAIKDYLITNKVTTAVVVGGGYIGLEMAENLTNIGIKTSIVEALDQVLAPLDYDMACDVRNYLGTKGVELYLSQPLEAIESIGDNNLAVHLQGGAVVDTQAVILAIGVRPESGLAQKAGLRCSERGGIQVDNRMQTSTRDIYAVGDATEVIDYVTGQPSLIPLAGPANKQGRIAADNICGIQSEYRGTQGSSILKIFDMTVATTGVNEKVAKRVGLDYEKSFIYSASHATYYPGASNMSIKTLFDKNSGKILGAQIVGFDGVDKRCDVLATAIRAGMTADDLTQLELCYAPPFSSAKDPVNMTGYVIENIVQGKVKIYHWHDIDSLYSRDDVQLVDTRTPSEYARGNIKGFVNIPLDELRTRLDEVDKSKIIYVHCQSGLRSYIACRILAQNGYDCYNLSGGYRLYNAIYNGMPSRPNEPQSAKKSDKLPSVTKLNSCGL